MHAIWFSDSSIGYQFTKISSYLRPGELQYICTYRWTPSLSSSVDPGSVFEAHSCQICNVPPIQAESQITTPKDLLQVYFVGLRSNWLITLQICWSYQNSWHVFDQTCLTSILATTTHANGPASCTYSDVSMPPQPLCVLTQSRTLHAAYSCKSIDSCCRIMLWGGSWLSWGCNISCRLSRQSCLE